jgi:hypothetical protein
VLRCHLYIVVVPAAVRLLILDAEVGEVHFVGEVRQVVLECPLVDLLLGPIGMSVVIGTVAITFVEPGLVLTLELVVEEDALNPRPALGQALRLAFVGAIDLEVVFEFPLAFEAIPERLAVPLVAIPMVFEQGAAVLRQCHGMLARPGHANGPDQPLLAQVSQVA